MADPYTTPIPGATGAGGYENATLAAKDAYSKAMIRLNSQRGDTLRQYGYAGDINADTGVVDNVRVDANLPYGLYQQEKNTHADQYDAARASAADRGLGHGGLAGQGITKLRHGFGADDAALGTGLSGSLAGFQDQQNQAKYTQDSTLVEAQLQQTRDAIAAQMFNPANVGDLSVPEGPDWDSIIAKLLGGDGGGGDGSGGGSGAPGPNAPNSPNSGAAMKTLLNPVKKPAPAPKYNPNAYVPASVSKPVAKAIVAAAKAPAKKKK